VPVYPTGHGVMVVFGTIVVVGVSTRDAIEKKTFWKYQYLVFYE